MSSNLNIKKSIDVEWEKIKNENLISKEELEKLILKTPTGKCMKKFTTYPWSKENFFFGTTEELNDYYKNSLDVPFYLKKHIGKVYKHLTITDLEVEIVGGKKRICAVCKCDCGNVTKKKLEYVLDGDTTSCGCAKKKKGLQKKTIFEIFPDVIKENWDYKKNNILPENIPYDSNEEFWWKGYKHSYKMPISALFSKLTVGTSFPEQTILYYLKQYFPDIKNRYKIKSRNKSYEFDIYIPTLNLAIEYDGVAWHDAKLIQDLNKNNIAYENNIFLIRIREKGLEEIFIENGKCIIYDNYSDYTGTIHNVINEIFEVLEDIATIQFKRISSNDVRDNKALIMGEYLCGFVNDNLQKSWLSKKYNELNDIPSYYISEKSKDKFKFRCACGDFIYVSPNRINTLLSMIDKKQRAKYYSDFTNNNVCLFCNEKECPRCVFYYEHENEPCKFMLELISDKASRKLWLTSYRDLKNEVINYIENIKKYTKEDFVKLQEFYGLLRCYKFNCLNIFEELLFNSFMRDDDKYEYLEKIATFPNYFEETVGKIFNNKKLLDFYIKHMSIIGFGSQIQINLDHEFKIYEILKSLIYCHKFDMLDYALESIKINYGQTILENIVLSLAIQVKVKFNYKFDNIFQSELQFSRLIKSLSIKVKNNIKKQQICTILKDDRNNVYKKFLSNWIISLVNLGTWDHYKLHVILRKNFDLSIEVIEDLILRCFKDCEILKQSIIDYKNMALKGIYQLRLFKEINVEVLKIVFSNPYFEFCEMDSELLNRFTTKINRIKNAEIAYEKLDGLLGFYNFNKEFYNKINIEKFKDNNLKEKLLIKYPFLKKEKNKKYSQQDIFDNSPNTGAYVNYTGLTKIDNYDKSVALNNETLRIIAQKIEISKDVDYWFFKKSVFPCLVYEKQYFLVKNKNFGTYEICMVKEGEYGSKEFELINQIRSEVFGYFPELVIISENENLSHMSLSEIVEKFRV